MKRILKAILNRTLSWCPIYHMALGGYRYYHFVQDRTYVPSQFLFFGIHSIISEGVEITAPERCHIGDSSGIGARSKINSVGGFHLGSHCMMAQECLVFTTEHRHAGAHALPFDTVRQVKPVHIGDYVWIGARAVIHPGVTIGDGAIVGMCAVVTRDVAPLSIVAGNPAEVVGRRSEAEFNELREAGRGRNPMEQCSILWVPPFIQRKHGALLKATGFNVVPGEACFIYDKQAKSLVRTDTSEALGRSKRTRR